MAERRRGREVPLPKVGRKGERAEAEAAPGALGVNIDLLPDEVMINIFSCFSFNELIDTVQNVCTRWKRLAQDPVLWLDKEYVVTSWTHHEKSCCRNICSKCAHRRISEESDEDVLRTVCSVPQLRTLKLKRDIKTCILRKICTNCPNLTNLDIHSIENMSYSLMKHIFAKCPKIQKLRLLVEWLTDRKYVDMLSGLEHLRSLGVGEEFFNPGTVQLRALADACPRLEEINFDWDYNFHTVDDFEYFFKATKHSLTSATLRWTIGETRCVVTLLKQCDTSLRKLRLFNFKPGGTEDEAFESVGELHSLHELCAEVFPYEPRVISLAFRPGCLTQLRRLQLRDCCYLLDETVVTISQGCPNLRELRIGFSKKITDGALSELHHLKHLEILDLSACSELGGAAVAYISQLPALHTLVLQCMIDLAKLQPSLRNIVDMKELRCLDIQDSHNVKAVPFDEFPGRLVKLRELLVTYKAEEELFYKNVFSELQRKMPDLKIVTIVQPTPEYSSDEESDAVADVGDNDGSSDSTRSSC